jgi:hypothetical protein
MVVNTPVTPLNVVPVNATVALLLTAVFGRMVLRKPMPGTVSPFRTAMPTPVERVPSSTASQFDEHSATRAWKARLPLSLKEGSPTLAPVVYTIVGELLVETTTPEPPNSKSARNATFSPASTGKRMPRRLLTSPLGSAAAVCRSIGKVSRLAEKTVLPPPFVEKATLRLSLIEGKPTVTPPE